MKKILRIVPTLYDPDNVSPSNTGGVQIQVYKLIDALSEFVEQDVYTCNKVGFKDDNITVYGLKGSISTVKFIMFLAGVIYHLMKNKKKYGLIHIHSNGALSPLLVGEFIYHFLNIPVIYTFHCCRNVNYIGKKIEFLTVPIMNFLEKKCIHHSKCNVFLSQYVVNELLKLGVIDDNVKYKIISDAIEEKNLINVPKVNNGIINITFIGRIHRQKGWEIFIKCARNFTDKPYIFNIYGTGPDLFKMKKMLKQYDLNNMVYHGNIPNTKVFDVINDSNVIVIPFRFEELGSIVLEAGIMKKNIVASSTGALREILDDKRGYLVNIDDVDGFCKSIEFAINNDENTGVSLYNYIKNNYMLEQSVKKHIALYNECMK